MREWLLKNKGMRLAMSRFERARGRSLSSEDSRYLASWVKSSAAFRELANRVESRSLERLDAAFDRWMATQANGLGMRKVQ